MVPEDLHGTGTSRDHAGSEILFIDQSLDLTIAQDTFLVTARTFMNWASEVAAVIQAFGIGCCVAATVVSETHGKLLWFHTSSPQGAKVLIDLLQICMWTDL